MTFRIDLYLILIIMTLTINLFSIRKAQAKDMNFGPLRPFTTDGCTHFPDGNKINPTQWQHCCVTHDLKYWAGGNKTQRLQADFELRACVANTGAYEIAEAMFIGVRLGGRPEYPTPFRWGYGWPAFRAFIPLNEEEREQVRSLTPLDLSKIPIQKGRGQ